MEDTTSSYFVDVVGYHLLQDVEQPNSIANKSIPPVDTLNRRIHKRQTSPSCVICEPIGFDICFVNEHQQLR